MGLLCASSSSRGEPRCCAALGNMLGGNLHLRRHAVHDMQQGASEDSELLVVAAGRRKDQSTFAGIGVQMQQLAQFANVRQGLFADSIGAKCDEGGLLFLSVLLDAHSNGSRELDLTKQLESAEKFLIRRRDSGKCGFLVLEPVHRRDGGKKDSVGSISGLDREKN